MKEESEQFYSFYFDCQIIDTYFFILFLTYPINNQKVRIAARPVNRSNSREIYILLELLGSAVLEEVVCFSVVGQVLVAILTSSGWSLPLYVVVVVTEIPDICLLWSHSISYNCRTSLIVIKLLNYHHFQPVFIGPFNIWDRMRETVRSFVFSIQGLILTAY